MVPVLAAAAFLCEGKEEFILVDKLWRDMLIIVRCTYVVYWVF